MDIKAFLTKLYELVGKSEGVKVTVTAVIEKKEEETARQHPELAKLKQAV